MLYLVEQRVCIADVDDLCDQSITSYRPYVPCTTVIHHFHPVLPPPLQINPEFTSFGTPAFMHTLAPSTVIQNS
jgi:hypothetical protein